jgi:hypothetical protein
MKTSDRNGWSILVAAVLGILLLAVAAPLKADTRRVDLRSGLRPPSHQGGRNTCNVFAATGLMEYLIRQQTGVTVDLSEAYNYWAGKNKTLTTAFLRRAYTHMDGLAGFLAVEAYRHGSMRESDWPYASRNWLQNGDSRCRRVGGSPETRCFTGTPPAGAPLLRYGISPIYVPRERIGTFILEQKKPVVINVLWCQGAIDNRTGRIRMPTAGQVDDAVQHHRGHVILLVGYDAARREFIFRNSYGPEWGDHGYGIVPEAYIRDHCEVCPRLRTMGAAQGEAVEFTRQAAMGVSGTLITLAHGEELGASHPPSESIFVKFAESTLVYVPDGHRVEIASENMVIASGKNWSAKRLASHLHWLKNASWRDFGWKINTATRKLYHSQHGRPDSVIGEITSIAGNPQVVLIRLDDVRLIFRPAKRIFQLSAGGDVLSYGDDWKTRQIGPKQYHLARSNWRDFFWLADTGRRQLFSVTGGRFGNPGGRQKPLAAVLRVDGE